MSRKYGVGSIYNRGNRLWTCYSVNGKTYRESSGSNKQSVAAALLKKRMAEAQSGRATAAENRQTPVSELLDDVVKYYASYRPKSHWWCRLVVETHLRPFFEFHKAERIGTTQVQKYIESRKKKGRSNATINRELAILRRAFKLAFDHDPPRVSRVPKIKDLPEDNVRTGFFEREPYEKLLAALPPEIKPLLVFGYFTGCRRGEILRLLWNQIDLDRRVVRLNSGETKNNERVIPLAKELVDCLRGHKRERDEFWPGCPYVFHRNGERIRSFKEAFVNCFLRLLFSGGILSRGFCHVCFPLYLSSNY